MIHSVSRELRASGGGSLLVLSVAGRLDPPLRFRRRSPGPGRRLVRRPSEVVPVPSRRADDRGRAGATRAVGVPGVLEGGGRSPIHAVGGRSDARGARADLGAVAPADLAGDRGALPRARVSRDLGARMEAAPPRRADRRRSRGAFLSGVAAAGFHRAAAPVHEAHLEDRERRRRRKANSFHRSG